MDKRPWLSLTGTFKHQIHSKFGKGDLALEPRFLDLAPCSRTILRHNPTQPFAGRDGARGMTALERHLDHPHLQETGQDCYPCTRSCELKQRALFSHQYKEEIVLARGLEILAWIPNHQFWRRSETVWRTCPIGQPSSKHACRSQLGS